MKPSIEFKKIWEDDDMIEITISVCDGRSKFVYDAYWGRIDLAETVKKLNIFKEKNLCKPYRKPLHFKIVLFHPM